MVISFNEVFLDSTRLKQTDWFPIGEDICECRDAPVRVDGSIPGFLLCVKQNVDFV